MPLLRLSNQNRSHARSANSQRGFVMIEMMLAVAIVGTAMLATVAAFSTASKTSGFVQQTTTAEWLAISQVELIRVAAFQVTPGVYTSVPAPTGYSVANATSSVVGGDENIQIVTVTVSRGVDPIYVTSALKVNH